MSAQSWLDSDVSEVAALLAKEAVARNLVKAAALPTVADLGQQFREFGANFGNKAREYGGQALNWLNEPGSEGLRYGLAGAGVGGLLGLGSEFSKDPDERQYGSAALTGALSGGAMGAGAGLLRQNSDGLLNKASPAAAPAETPPAAKTPGPAFKDDAGSAAVDAATAGAAMGEGSAPLSVDEQLQRVNQGIAEGEQQQGAAASGDLRRALGTGSATAATVMGAEQFLQNRPAALLGRGVDAAVEGGMKGYSPEAQAAITKIKNAPSSMPLNRGLLSAYFDPQLPHWSGRFVDSPATRDTVNPLGQMADSLDKGYVQPAPHRTEGPVWRNPEFETDLGHAAKDVAKSPAAVPLTRADLADLPGTVPGKRTLQTEFNWGRLRANPDDMNPYFRGLSNAEVRKLGGPLYQGKRPSYLGLGGAAAAGLLPIIMALAGDRTVQQQQQTIAKGFSGN